MKARKGSLGKTTRPSLAGVLPRKRLFASLDEARDAAVVWISGPPGCGKTTLAAGLESGKAPALRIMPFTAGRLGISVHTVTSHVKNCYRKLDVHCAAAAVMRAVELRILAPQQ